MRPPGPPAIVFGVDTPIGLTIARELGGRGVEVTGIGRSTTALGRFSRHVRHFEVRPTDDEGIAAMLRGIAARSPDGALLLAVSESDIVVLNRLRDRVPGVRMLIPRADRFAAVLDKAVTLRAAEAAGVPVPWTLPLDEIVAGGMARYSGRFPVVAKWPNPLAAQPRLAAIGVPFEKLAYCYNWADLERMHARLAPAGVFPLVQEHCPGYGLGQFVLMHHGAPILTFQHRRVHEWPPEGGFASLCESLPSTAHRETMERSIALLRALDWEGAAMVEYRYDPASDRAVLMEINGRFWGSQPLARHAGALFGWTTYAVLGEVAQAGTTPYRAGVRCCNGIPEIKRLLRIVLHPELVADKSLHFSRSGELARYLLTLLDPRTRYYVASWSDPMPFFADLFFGLSRAARRIMGRPGR